MAGRSLTFVRVQPAEASPRLSRARTLPPTTNSDTLTRSVSVPSLHAVPRAVREEARDLERPASSDATRASPKLSFNRRMKKLDPSISFSQLLRRQLNGSCAAMRNPCDAGRRDQERQLWEQQRGKNLCRMEARQEQRDRLAQDALDLLEARMDAMELLRNEQVFLNKPDRLTLLGMCADTRSCEKGMGMARSWHGNSAGTTQA